MKSDEERATPKWLRAPKARCAKQGLLFVFLVLLLIPNVLQLRVLLREDEPDYRGRVKEASDLAMWFLPPTLFCIAALFLQGASRRDGAGGITPPYPKALDVPRVLLLTVALGVLFYPMVFFGAMLFLFCGFVLRFEGFLLFTVPFVFGFISVLAICSAFLKIQGFRANESCRARWMAAGAFALVMTIWCIVFLVGSAVAGH